jgi:hypothetical protein
MRSDGSPFGIGITRDFSGWISSVYTAVILRVVEDHRVLHRPCCGRRSTRSTRGGARSSHHRPTRRARRRGRARARGPTSTWWSSRAGRRTALADPVGGDLDPPHRGDESPAHAVGERLPVPERDRRSVRRPAKARAAHAAARKRHAAAPRENRPIAFAPGRFWIRLTFAIMEAATHIHVKGAREHNLKNLDLRIPRGKLVVITGPSGSGQVVARLRHDLRRGLPQIHGEPLDPGPPGARPAEAPRRRLHPRALARPGDRAATGGVSPRTRSPPSPRFPTTRLLWALAGEQRCPKDGGRVVQRSLDDNVAGSSPSARASGSCSSRRSSGRSRASCATSSRGCASAGSSGCGSGAIRELDEPNLIPAGAAEVAGRRGRRPPGGRRRAPQPHRRFPRARVPRGRRPGLRAGAAERRGAVEGARLSQHLACESAATCSRS